MKTLKEIEDKLKKIRTLDAGAWSTRTCTKAKEARLFIKADAQRFQGWIEGLGIAKGTYYEVVFINGGSVNVEFRDSIGWALDRVGELKTPYEQGIKEALTWCLEGD